MKAAALCADVSQRGGLIYGLGAGHSHLVIEDAFWRAATVANYAALLEPSVTGTFDITKSYLMENTYDVGRHIVDYHRVTPNDLSLIHISMTSQCNVFKTETTYSLVLNSVKLVSGI